VRRWGRLQPARLYDIFAELLGVSNLFSLALCAFLTWKGLHAPSTSDAGSNGSLVYDFYWGAPPLRSLHVCRQCLRILYAARRSTHVQRHRFVHFPAPRNPDDDVMLVRRNRAVPPARQVL
jgi:hypothetical protein